MESENITDDEFAFDFHAVESIMASAAARVTHSNCPCSPVCCCVTDLSCRYSFNRQKAKVV